MTVTYERRDGRITESEYRAVVTVGEKSAAGPWQFTKAVARKDVEGLRRSLFDVEEVERRLDASSHARCARIRQQLEVDRRVAWVA